MIPADIDNFVVYNITDFYNPGSICIMDQVSFFPKEVSNCTMLKGMIFENYGRIMKIESFPGYNLEYLTINRSKIGNISALAKSKSLTRLRLDYNNITDTYALAKIKSLTYLSLDYNNITDISAFSKCASLEVLSLQNNKIEDISALSKCTALTKLYLQHNRIVDASPLEKCTKLQILNLAHNRIKYIPILSELELFYCEMQEDIIGFQKGKI